MANPVKVFDNVTDISKSVDWKSLDAISVLTKETGTFKFNVRQGVGQTYPAKTISMSATQILIKFNNYP